MNYCIQIVSATGPDTSVPFIEDVYRLGRDGKCEIRVSTKAAHALTVFRRSASIFVLNRTKLPIPLGKTPLTGGATAEWTPNTSILIDGIRLKLQRSSGGVSDASAVVAVCASRSTSSLAKTSASAPMAVPSPANGQTKSQTLQFAVIVGCLMMIVLMLFLGNQLDSNHETQFEQIAELSASLSDIASEKNPDVVSRNRTKKLLKLLAQYRVSMVVEEKSYAHAAKAEARDFCESIAKASRLPDEERKIVRQLSVLLGQVL